MSVDIIDAPNLFTVEKLEDRNNYILNGTFRCDRCGAQAYVRATFKNDLELLFCAHHARKHYPTTLSHLKEWYTEEIRLKDENRLVGSEN